ncbi:hypothetical protein B0H12DRAFT_1232543 [Mycena haematopus]|nr:hypothetical protein B0H12DRAFT_1232543 [Mycena haematopus]
MLSYMDADRRRLSQIETQILDFERSLSALRAEEKLAQEHLDSYKYPVLTLPNEIVSEIFVQVLSPYPICPPPIGILSPTSLTHICRKWREVALTTPELWRVIAIPLPVDLQGHKFEFFPAPYPAIFYRRERWEYLMLSDYSFTLPVPMPLLRHLELKPKGNGVFEFRDAPQLRTVILREFIGVTAILPWEQLTSLTMEVATSQWASILPQTTNLVHCDVLLFCFGPDGVDSDPGSHLTLPFLESLVFMTIPEDKGTRFLDTLTVPALRSLTIPERCLGRDPIRYLTSFIARSRCRLQILSISKRTLPEISYRFAFPFIPKFAFNNPYSAVSSGKEDSGSDEEDEDSDGDEEEESE